MAVIRAVMLVEECHFRRIKTETLSELRLGRIDSSAVRSRVDRQLHDHRQSGWTIAKGKCGDDRQGPAGAVAAQDQTGELPPERRGIVCDPARRRLGIVRRSRPGMFGSEPVFDRDDRQVEAASDLGGKSRMGVDAPEDKAAAVEEDHHRAWSALASWIEQ